MTRHTPFTPLAKRAQKGPGFGDLENLNDIGGRDRTRTCGQRRVKEELPLTIPRTYPPPAPLAPFALRGTL